ncbi:MAG: prenyltransferase [Micrococcales bacterium]
MVALAKQLFWASRPVSWVNTAYPFALTYLLVTGKMDNTFWVGTLFFLIPYNLLMYGINDVFDYESDLRNPRKGSIEGAVLHKKWHRPTLFYSFMLPLPFVSYLLVHGNLVSAAALLIVLFTVVAYSAPVLRFKERPVLDSLTSACHFVGPMVFALAFTGVDLFQPDVLKVTVAFALWGMASHAFGAVQDIKADRAGGLASIATAFGAANTGRFAFACYLIAGGLLATVPGPAALAAIAVVPYLVVVLPFLRLSDQDCERANRGWRRFIWLNFFAGAVVTLLAIQWLRGSN